MKRIIFVVLGILVSFSYAMADQIEKTETATASIYRIQIYASHPKEAAEEAAKEARKIFTKPVYKPVYVERIKPYWKVRVGDCALLDAARELLVKVKAKGYKDAWIVQAEILITPTKTIKGEEEEIEKLEEEKEILEKELEQKVDKLTLLVKESTELKVRVETLEKKIKWNSIINYVLSLAIIMLVVWIVGLRKGIARKKEAVQSLRKENESLKAQIDSLNIGKRRLERENEELKGKNEELQSELNQLKLKESRSPGSQEGSTERRL